MPESDIDTVQRDDMQSTLIAFGVCAGSPLAQWMTVVDGVVHAAAATTLALVH